MRGLGQSRLHQLLCWRGACQTSQLQCPAHMLGQRSHPRMQVRQRGCMAQTCCTMARRLAQQRWLQQQPQLQTGPLMLEWGLQQPCSRRLLALCRRRQCHQAPCPAQAWQLDLPAWVQIALLRKRRRLSRQPSCRAKAPAAVPSLQRRQLVVRQRLRLRCPSSMPSGLPAPAQGSAQKQLRPAQQPASRR